MVKIYLLIDVHSKRIWKPDGFDGQCSRGLANISRHFWVSLDGCTRSVKSSWQLVRLSASCRTSVPRSAEPNGLSFGTPSCLLQLTGPCVCWWPLCMDVPSHLKVTKEVLFPFCFFSNFFSQTYFYFRKSKLFITIIVFWRTHCPPSFILNTQRTFESDKKGDSYGISLFLICIGENA